MDNNIIIDKNTGEVTETTAPAAKYNLEYALEQIERIANDTEHITKAIDALETVAVNNEPTLEQGGANDKVAEAINETVKARETTNQKLIEFYSKMVEDLKPTKALDEKEMFLKYMADAEGKRRPGTGSTNYAELWKTMKD